MKKFVLALTLLAAVSGLAQNPKLSPDLSKTHDKSMADVIIRYKVAPSVRHRNLITSHHGAVLTDLSFIKSLHASVPASRLARLARDKDVAYITPNRSVSSKLFNTTGAVNAQTAWNLGLDGTGVGVALIDSGVNNHPDLKSQGQSSVVESFDTLGGGTADLYGHGTHVAGIIAGNGASSSCNNCDIELHGLASGVSLVSFHALDLNGNGTDSSVIEAIDEAILFKTLYNIRVLNLSLGRPVYESYTQDPLCQAVEAAWKAGIVVVVAAGNDGRDNSAGTNGYGTIAAPGNDPYVITVGAMNAMGTPDRSDDIMTTYSSKGPTPIDHIVKPDLVAPGNQVIS
ncbi:MAG: S8 family serine peptidase, partial [Terriglobales bacterium]